jgi:hypothetical protein
MTDLCLGLFNGDFSCSNDAALNESQRLWKEATVFYLKGSFPAFARIDCGERGNPQTRQWVFPPPPPPDI